MRFRGQVVALVLAVVALGGLVAWLAARKARSDARADERREFLQEFGIVSDGRQDFVALPTFLPHNAAMAAIGSGLFRDRRIARTVRRTCGACHLLNAGGTDGKTHGGSLTRPVMNASFSPVFLHDGSVTGMQNLVRHMVESRDFCGGGPMTGVVARLSQDLTLAERFRTAYGEEMCVSNVLESIVQYGRTLVTSGMPLDRYCGGRKEAMSADAVRGMGLFSERGCLSCHDGPALGGMKVSEGRKVPALRGISLRHIYFAGGFLRADLSAVLALMPGGDFEADERMAVEAFLKSL